MKELNVIKTRSDAAIVTMTQFDVARSQKDVPPLVAAIEAVLGLHKPMEGLYSADECEACTFPAHGVYVGYPCPTVEAIERALKEVKQ